MGSIHKFYLVEPEAKASMERLVDLLLGQRPIKSVSILCCDGGFFVRLGFFTEREPKDVFRYVKKKITPDYGYVLPYRSAH